MDFTPRLTVPLTVIALAFIGVAWSQSTTPQLPYTYSTRFDESNNHFVVDITNTGPASLICTINYSGHTFLDADKSGQRTITIRAVSVDSKPVIGSAHFGGFRGFTATVQCNTK